MDNTQNSVGGTPLPIYVKNQTIECNIGSQISVPPTITNGSGNLTWRTDSPLPSGLNLNPSTGYLTGIPEGIPFQDIFTVEVSSDNGVSGSAEYTIVANPPLGFKIDTQESLPLERTSGYSIDTRIEGTGGSGQYKYSVYQAPNGIAIGSLSGVISGVLKNLGSQSIIILIDDGISTYQATINYNIVPSQSNPVGLTTQNFTRRRLADIGMEKLTTAISLRSENPPEYINSAQDLLDATRKLCQDPTSDFLNDYADMHKTYGATFLNEDYYFIGMEDFDYNSYEFMAVIYNAFRQVIWYRNPSAVNFNRLLIYSRSQTITQYLYNYSNSF